MKTSRITGRVELLEKLSQLLSTRVLEAHVEEGEAYVRLPDGTPRVKRNGSSTVTIQIAGGALDTGRTVAGKDAT